MIFLPLDERFSRIFSTQFISLYVTSFSTNFYKIKACFSSSISDNVWLRYSSGILEMSFLIFMFNFNPISKNELNYFLAWSSGNIYGVRLGVSSYGLKIYFLEDNGESNNTPNEVLTAISFEFNTTILFTSTSSFILISETYRLLIKIYVKLFSTG